MNRNVLITVVVILIIVAAGGYWFINQSKVAPAVPETLEPSISPSATIQKSSLKNFMAMAGTQKCDFSDTESSSSGIVYLDSGKMRGDFSSNISGKITPSHMINDGEAIYIWMDDQLTGFKTTLEAIEKVSGTTGSTQTVDINKQVDYQCGSWSMEPDKFKVPTDKKFNDMSKMMESTAKMMSSIKPAASEAEESAATCSACDSLEGQAKTQCRSALKCN